jgi:hypothetical protein
MTTSSKTIFGIFRFVGSGCVPSLKLIRSLSRNGFLERRDLVRESSIRRRDRAAHPTVGCGARAYTTLRNACGLCER